MTFRPLSIGTAVLVAVGVTGTAHSAPSYLRVAGVEYGAVVWIHTGPDEHYPVVGFLTATSRHIAGFGCVAIHQSSWCRVRYRGIKGWAPEEFLVGDDLRGG